MSLPIFFSLQFDWVAIFGPMKLIFLVVERFSVIYPVTIAYWKNSTIHRTYIWEKLNCPMIKHIQKVSLEPFKVVEVKGGWGVEYWDFDLFFSCSYSVKTALTLKNVKQIVTIQIIWRGQKEGKSAKECQDNFSH